MTITWI